jgi:phasin family protein
MMRQSFGHCMSTSKTLLSAKTPQEMADIQSTYVKECMDSAMTGSGTLSEISARAARESMEPLTRHANDTVGLMMQKTKAA